MREKKSWQPQTLYDNLSQRIFLIMLNKEKSINALTRNIIGCAIEVHKNLGPGLLESVYESCLHFEIISLGLKVEKQKPLPIVYKDWKLEAGYRLDLLVEDEVIVEVKSVESLNPIHKAQIISYIKLSDCKAGLLINFNVMILTDGIFRTNRK